VSSGSQAPLCSESGNRDFDIGFAKKSLASLCVPQQELGDEKKFFIPCPLQSAYQCLYLAGGAGIASFGSTFGTGPISIEGEAFSSILGVLSILRVESNFCSGGSGVGNLIMGSRIGGGGGLNWHIPSVTLSIRKRGVIAKRKNLDISISSSIYEQLVSIAVRNH
jgi:hypothetical protein